MCIKASALLLYSPDQRPGEAVPRAHSKMLAYATNSSWIVFQLELPFDWREYTLGQEERDGWMQVDLSLRWPDGTVFELRRADPQQPIDVAEVFDGNVSQVLVPKVAKYWRGVNMPLLNWARSDDVRALVNPPPGR